MISKQQPPKSPTLRLGLSLEPKQAKALTQFLEFAQITPFLKTGMGKNSIYFKNIAIAVFLMQYSEEESKQIFKNVALRCKPHKYDGMMTWWRWCKAQKHELEVNWNEIRRFYEKS